MPPSSKEVVRLLLDDGWYLDRQKGSHAQYRHRLKLGTVTVPMGQKDLGPDTLRSIERQCGLPLRKIVK